MFTKLSNYSANKDHHFDVQNVNVGPDGVGVLKKSKKDPVD